MSSGERGSTAPLTSVSTVRAAASRLTVTVTSVGPAPSGISSGEIVQRSFVDVASSSTRVSVAGATVSAAVPATVTVSPVSSV